MPPVEVAGRDFPTNRGGLCKKGWTSAELLRSPQRLLAPLVRGADGGKSQLIIPVTAENGLFSVGGEPMGRVPSLKEL